MPVFNLLRLKAHILRANICRQWSRAFVPKCYWSLTCSECLAFAVEQQLANRNLTRVSLIVNNNFYFTIRCADEYMSRDSEMLSECAYQLFSLLAQ